MFLIRYSFFEDLIMMRKWMNWAAVGALAMSLAACGDSGSTTPAAPSTPPATPTTGKAVPPTNATVTVATDTATRAPEGNLMDLELTLPKPQYIGTVKNLPQWAQLALLDAKARPTIKVPVGCTNVALHKPVSASGGALNGELSFVTDGDKTGVEGTYVELGPDVQWFQVDLKDKYAIYAIAVWRYHQNSRVFHSVVVQVSDDKDFVTGVTTVFNNDTTNGAGLGVGADKEFVEKTDGQLIEVKGVKGQYVRLYSKGSTADEDNQMEEVEVYGLPAK